MIVRVFRGEGSAPRVGVGGVLFAGSIPSFFSSPFSPLLSPAVNINCVFNSYRCMPQSNVLLTIYYGGDFTPRIASASRMRKDCFMEPKNKLATAL